MNDGRKNQPDEPLVDETDDGPQPIVFDDDDHSQTHRTPDKDVDEALE